YLELPFPINSIGNEFVSIIDAQWLINEKQTLESTFGISDFIDGLSVDSNPVMIRFALEEIDEFDK
ncbi:MAG: hypothetical protein PHR37_07470, partial [Eubacteriales bacterium]|nr:hypothetical protein [Eubacteriales bacterium]